MGGDARHPGDKPRFRSGSYLDLVPAVNLLSDNLLRGVLLAGVNWEVGHEYVPQTLASLQYGPGKAALHAYSWLVSDAYSQSSPGADLDCVGR